MIDINEYFVVFPWEKASECFLDGVKWNFIEQHD